VSHMGTAAADARGSCLSAGPETLIRGDRDGAGSEGSRLRRLAKAVCRMLCGSVFPKAAGIAAACATLACVLREFLGANAIDLSGAHAPLKEYAAWSSFSFLVGFLIVFRTSQAYLRFCEGSASAHHMRAAWFDACSCLVAFCKCSQKSVEVTAEFQQLLVRLFSLLHAVALAEIEDSHKEEVENVEAFTFEIIEADGLDEQTLRTLLLSKHRVQLVYQWIQSLVVEHVGAGVLSIPPPLLSSAFQQISHGMVSFHQADKINRIPFPVPYGQVCNGVLAIHWLLLLFVGPQWVTELPWLFIFTFIQVFILWSLNFIALDLQNPFGQDATDLDCRSTQRQMNKHLRLLLKPETQRTPKLTSSPVSSQAPLRDARGRRASLLDVWRGLEVGQGFVPIPLGRTGSAEKTCDGERFQPRGRSFVGLAAPVSRQSGARVTAHSSLPTLLDSRSESNSSASIEIGVDSGLPPGCDRSRDLVPADVSVPKTSTDQDLFAGQPCPLEGSPAADVQPEASALLAVLPESDANPMREEEAPQNCRESCQSGSMLLV